MTKLIHENRMIHKAQILCFCLSFLLLNLNFLCAGREIPDPFLKFDILKKSSVVRKKESVINLLGIIKEKNKFGAILVKDHQKEIVFLQDKVWGYKVAGISFNNVLLVRDGLTKKLEMIT